MGQRGLVFGIGLVVGVISAAGCGGDIVEPGPGDEETPVEPAPAEAVTLELVGESPIKTSSDRAELVFKATGPVGRVTVAGNLATKDGDVWRYTHVFTEGCGAASNQIALDVVVRDEKDATRVTFPVWLERNACGPEVTFRMTHYDERQMKAAADASGRPCLFRSPDQQPLTSTTVHRYRISARKDDRATCAGTPSTMTPPAGWIFTKNLILVSFNLADAQDVDETSIVVKLGDHVVPHHVEVQQDDVQGHVVLASDELPTLTEDRKFVLQVESKDKKGVASSHSFEFTQVTLPGPVLLGTAPATLTGTELVDLRDCSLAAGDFEPCVTKDIATTLAYEVINPTDWPVRVKIGLDAKVQLSASLAHSYSNPQTSWRPGDEWKCGAWWTWLSYNADRYCQPERPEQQPSAASEQTFGVLVLDPPLVAQDGWVTLPAHGKVIANVRGHAFRPVQDMSGHPGFFRGWNDDFWHPDGRRLYGTWEVLMGEATWQVSPPGHHVKTYREDMWLTSFTARVDTPETGGGVSVNVRHEYSPLETPSTPAVYPVRWSYQTTEP
jgi:hypothetical protein